MLKVRKLLALLGILFREVDAAEGPLAGFLTDLANAGRLHQTCHQLRQQLADAKAAYAQTWIQNTEQVLSSREVASLETSGRVMEFDAVDHTLKVTEAPGAQPRTL